MALNKLASLAFLLGIEKGSVELDAARTEENAGQGAKGANAGGSEVMGFRAACALKGGGGGSRMRQELAERLQALARGVEADEAMARDLSEVAAAVEWHGIGAENIRRLSRRHTVQAVMMRAKFAALVNEVRKAPRPSG